MRSYASWSAEIEPGDLDEIVKSLSIWELTHVAESDIVKRTWDYVLGSDYMSILNSSFDYGSMTEAEAYHLRQVYALYTKRTGLPVTFDRKAIAIDKFKSSEVLCRETNDIFRLRTRGDFQFSHRVESVLQRARLKIQSILGDVPALGDLPLRFGPGATTSVPRRTASPRAKLGSLPTCSSELFPLIVPILREMPLWLESLLESFGGTPRSALVQPGKVQFVPKSAKEERAIVVEPLLNTMCQAGIGSLMARALRRSGVDIKNQKTNQDIARLGSITDSYSTIDLSSASDTVATELVYDLLGVDWSSFLSHFRTGTVMLEGTELRLEKFSSMGNGFTFPLETLIFYALAYSATREVGASTALVNAYGDDIVIPSVAHELLSETLTACGFLVNEKKSYSSGPFRESCGADYFHGIDIRPIYLKETDGKVRVCDLFRLHNHYHRRFAFDVCTYLTTFFDPSIRIYGPDGYGDGHLLGEQEPRRKKSHVARGFSGWVFDTFSWKPKSSFKSYSGDRVLPSYTTYVLADAVSETDHVRSTRGDSFSVTIPGRESYHRKDRKSVV